LASPAAKLDGYRRRIVYEWNQHRQRVAARKREKIFDAWLSRLATDPPDVLLGANFAAYGGVRHHLQAIQRYSTVSTGLAPPEQVMASLATHHVVHDFRDKFWRFPAKGIKVVHSHVFPWYIEWCQEQQARGKRWVHTYHLNYYPEHANDGLEPWQEEINQALLNVACHADVCLAVSKWQVEELRSKHGITAHYLPNGVDVSKCDSADASRFVKKTGLSDFILYVGRNDSVKNPADFARLAARLPEFMFVMIGGGLSGDVLRTGWNIEVPNNLRVFGSMPHAEVLDAIAACSVLVVTSKREGLPTLVMEGMALEKPVVVPNEAGCMEVIGHGEAGLIYEQGNIEDLTAKSLSALQSPETGEIARQRVLREYDWRTVISKLDAIYRAEPVN
jgi:glycosyltransferase involved in cell wall biosynthesis